MKKNILFFLTKSNSLKIVVTFPFILELIITVSIVGYLSFKNGEKTVNNIATQLLFEIANKVEKQLKNYTQSVNLVNQFNRQIIVNDNLYYKSEQKQKILNYFYSQVQLFPKIHHVYWANKYGEFYGIRKHYEKKATFLIVADKNTDHYLNFYRIDSYLNLITDKTNN